jgi:hypothetical protein
MDSLDFGHQGKYQIVSTALPISLMPCLPTHQIDGLLFVLQNQQAITLLSHGKVDEPYFLVWGSIY